jgi:hypothetical protein
MSKAYEERDRQTDETPIDQISDLEDKLKEIDRLYADNPTQALLDIRFLVLAEMMKERAKNTHVQRGRRD